MSWLEYVLMALVIWNTAVFFLYGLDKNKAKRDARRISEKTLLLSAAFMGGLGALLGIYVFRHKTKHAAFKVGVPLLMIVNIAVTVLYLAYFFQSKSFTEFQSEFLTNTRQAELENYIANYQVEGAGEAVILIHGGGSWLYSYRENISVFSEHFEVYALDMPGHGYTTAINEPRYDLDTYADYIYEFMELLQIEKASLVGHSWGGGWAIHFAAKYPDKVDKLILIASSGLDTPDKSEWRFLSYPVLGEIITNFITLNATKNSLESMVNNPAFVTDLYAKEIYAPLSRYANRRSQFLSQRNLDWSITDKAIKELNQQTLLAFGNNDPYFDTDYAEQMNRRFGNSTLVWIDDAGHLPHEEKPHEVNRLLLDFLLDGTEGVSRSN